MEGESVLLLAHFITEGTGRSQFFDFFTESLKIYCLWSYIKICGAMSMGEILGRFGWKVGLG